MSSNQHGRTREAKRSQSNSLTYSLTNLNDKDIFMDTKQIRIVSIM